jgi:hypothetical protein
MFAANLVSERCAVSSVTSNQESWKTEKSQKSDFGCFLFSNLGPVHTPLHPVIGGAGCQLESLPSFQWDPKSRLGTCPSPSGAPQGSIPGDRLNLSDFHSAMRIPAIGTLLDRGNSKWGNWDPQFQFGQLANWQFNPSQFPQFNGAIQSPSH